MLNLRAETRDVGDEVERANREADNIRSVNFLKLNLQQNRIDPDWVYANVRRTAFYTNLPPGDYLIGGSGADTFRLDRAGSVTLIDGGAGSDTLDYSNRATAVSVDLEIGAATDINGGASGGLVASSGIDNSIEQVRGGSAGDTLYGDPDMNTLIAVGTSAAYFASESVRGTRS